MNKNFNIITGIVLTIFLSGCATTSKEMLTLSETSLHERQIQEKSFNTVSESAILSSSVSTLQDMGFNIDEINRDYGVVTCSKTRDARETGQQVGLFLLAILGGGARTMDLADHVQKIRATVVVTPKNGKNTNVRLTLMRVVSNSKGRTNKVENIKDVEIYKHFFSRLSKSVFLEESQI